MIDKGQKSTEGKRRWHYSEQRASVKINEVAHEPANRNSITIPMKEHLTQVKNVYFINLYLA